MLQTLVEFAARLYEADKGVILRPSGKEASYYVAASYHQNPQYAEYLRNSKFALGRGSVVSRVLLEGKSVQISDVLADPEYTSRELASVGDFRTVLGVPLLRDGVQSACSSCTGLPYVHSPRSRLSSSRPSPTRR